jgi:hypothetical protein
MVGNHGVSLHYFLVTTGYKVTKKPNQLKALLNEFIGWDE